MLENQKKALNLHRVFHSIRFKVNKIGLKRQPFFLCLYVKIRFTLHSSLSTLRASCRFAMSRSS